MDFGEETPLFRGEVCGFRGRVPPGIASGAGGSGGASNSNLYLLTSFAGPVDFGGGPVTALATDTVIASLSPPGAHRLSRALSIAGWISKGIDGCGGLVIASASSSFDVGYGPTIVLPPPSFPSIGVARFAP